MHHLWEAFGCARTAYEDGHMIKVIQSEERHHVDIGWLSTHWHFPFAETTTRKHKLGGSAGPQ
jgi:hypothetical protein